MLVGRCVWQPLGSSSPAGTILDEPMIQREIDARNGSSKGVLESVWSNKIAIEIISVNRNRSMQEEPTIIDLSFVAGNRPRSHGPAEDSFHSQRHSHSPTTGSGIKNLLFSG